MRHIYIEDLEKKDGVLSKMEFHPFNSDVSKFLDEKNIQRVYENSKILITGDAKWVEIIYKTHQPFYLHLKNFSENEPNWILDIYYKPEQLNELLVFIRQVLKQLRDATINN